MNGLKSKELLTEHQVHDPNRREHPGYIGDNPNRDCMPRVLDTHRAKIDRQDVKRCF